MGKIYLTEKTIKELIIIKGDIPQGTKMRKNYVPHLEAIKFLIEHYKKCKNRPCILSPQKGVLKLQKADLNCRNFVEKEKKLVKNRNSDFL